MNGRFFARTKSQRRLTHDLFEVAVILKGLNGLLELAGGMALLLIKTETIVNWVSILSRQELSKDPADPLANLLTHWAAGFGHTSQIMGAFYLLFHGVAKTGLATLLLLGFSSAYPIAIAFFSVFVAYAGFRLSQSWSWPLGGLVVLDLLTILIIAREWIALRRAAP